MHRRGMLRMNNARPAQKCKHRRTTAAAAATARQVSCFANGVMQTGTVQTSQCLHLTPQVACTNTHLQTPYTHHHFLTHPSSICQVELEMKGRRKKTKKFARVVLEMSIAIRKPKNARAKRAMLAREPKMVEGDRAALWMRGTTVGQQFIAPSSAYHLPACLF